MAETKATQTYIRRDIWSVETPNTWDPLSLAYANAVGEMQSRKAQDPTSWAYQASIHGSYDQPPAGADWNQCQHASWFFLSWHRMYIYWFERIVRAIVVQQNGPADWALPYWNYSKGYPSNTLPPAFRQETLPDGSANPLNVPAPRRNPNPPPGINGGNQLPHAATSYATAYSYTNFLPRPAPGFGGGRSPARQFENATGALENQPHNVIHDLVGGPTGSDCEAGWMSDPNCAARDPIFWLHHSNIDRLWVNWLLQSGGRASPTDSSWLHQPFTFHDENRTKVTMTGADVLDISQLSYRYDDEPPPVARRVVPAIKVSASMPTLADTGDSPVNMLAASEGHIELGSRPTTVAVALPNQAKDAVNQLVAAPAETAPMNLNVEGIQLQRHPGLVYEIYLNLPDAGPTTDPNNDHFVGYVTFFGAQHAHGGGEQPDTATAGMKHTYDITPVVTALKNSGRWKDDRMTVTFVPRGLLPPPGAATEAVAEGVEPSVAIGRVTITSG